MTTSDYRKAFKQLKAKPVILEKYKRHNAPKERTTGQYRRHCDRCYRTQALVNKYGLCLCRHCFREIAPSLGFKKYN